jgi:hypothetical protein
VSAVRHFGLRQAPSSRCGGCQGDIRNYLKR